MTRLPVELIYLNSDALPAWPVAWGVPFSPGAVADETALSLRSPEGAVLPSQVRVLTRHADGSVARALVFAEPAVPAESHQQFELRGDRAASPNVTSPAQCTHNRLSGAAGTLAIINGSLVLTTPDEIFSAELMGRARPRGSSNWENLQWQWQSVAPVKTGPVVASAVFHAMNPLLDVCITVRVSARTPVLFLDVLAKNLSPHTAIEIERFALRLARRRGLWLSAEHEVRQVPAIQTAKLPLTICSKKLAIEMETPAGRMVHARRLLNYNETWIALHGGFAEGAHALIAARNFFECFPWNIEAYPSSITFDFWPATHHAPWILSQGSGKTHEIALAFPQQPDSPPSQHLSAQAFGYAFGKPPMPRVPLEHHQRGGSLTGLLPYDRNRYPRLETTLYDLVYNRNRGYGKMHWGDDYSVLYTNQLRGRGEIVWNNLEGDHPFHMFCQFVRTGRYIYFKEFRDAIRHWADVDFCDRADDPLREGALIVHSANHASGDASPCHNWAEGFREWYFATGDPRPLNILGKMADWLMRQHAKGFFKTDPQPYVRGCGWGLIQMAAIQQVLARADIENIARDLCLRLLNYCRANNGLVMTMPTGGTRTRRDNAFHTATVVIGAYRCWEIYRENAMRDLAVTAAEALMDERTCTPEGIAVYISGPEQDFPMQQASGLALGGLAVAWQLTGDARFVRRGMRMLEYCLDRGMIVDHMRIPGEFIEIGDDIVLNVPMLMPNTQLLSYQLRGLLLFMAAAHETGMLQNVDYRY